MFILFYFILFCFVLFYLVLICFILLYFIVLYFILFCFISFYFIWFYFVLFYFVLFCFIFFYFFSFHFSYLCSISLFVALQSHVCSSSTNFCFFIYTSAMSRRQGEAYTNYRGPAPRKGFEARLYCMSFCLSRY